MRRLPLITALTACSGAPAALPLPTLAPVSSTVSTVPAPPAAQSVAPTARAPVQRAPVQIATGGTPTCEAFDWTPRKLPLLLRPGKAARGQHADQASAEQGAFDSQCEDAPDGASERSPRSVTIDGVHFDLASTNPAGKSGRGWSGNQCAFSASLADGSGTKVSLGAREIPPFNTIRAVVRARSAVFVSVSFNGYTKEFPQGGNRVLALDLCAGRLVWQSPNSTSNGGLLLLGDYLIAPFGFTAEPRWLNVLDARTGATVQRLPVVENICPSERWAPNWQRGERCDAPGQRVGAATNPRVSENLLLVDTNTGSAAFQFE